MSLRDADAHPAVHRDERDGPADQGPRREVPAGHRAAARHPARARAITDKCLTRSRANRYQTAAEAEGDLRAFLRKFMPNYSRSHLGRFIRKMFAQEIERELRMLEEYVMADDVSEDVGESLMLRDEDFEPPEVPFQPKPTSVSIAAIGAGTNGGDSRVNDFSSDSNFTTMPKVDSQDIHGANTVILEDRGRRAPPRPPPPGRRVARTQPPPPPPRARRSRACSRTSTKMCTRAPTMIIDIGRMRQRRR